MRILLLLLAVLVPASASSQETEWTKLTGPAGDLTAMMPKGCLVDNERSELRAYFAKGEASITFTILRNVNPKARLREMRQWRIGSKGNYSQMELGQFEGDVFIFEEKGYAISFYLASKKGFYSISGSAKSSTDPVLLKFFMSIRLDGRPLINQTNPTDDPGPGSSLDKYQTTPAIAEALNRPDAKNARVTYEKKTGGPDATETKASDEKTYSSRLIILRNPRGRYTARARNDNVQGSIMLRVQLKGDGQVGDIHVLSGLPGGLTNSALEAAKAIKFLPAEINGKPVDVEKTFEYTFSIY